MADQKLTQSSPLLFGLIRITVSIASRLPLRVARALGAAIGVALWHLPTSFRRVTQTNLELCFPELTARQRRRLGRRSAAETGKGAAESGAILRWESERLATLVTATENEDLLTAAVGRGRGVVLLLLHLGNWELLAPWLRPRHASMALYRPPRLAEFDSLLLEARQRSEIEMVPANPRGLKRALRGLSEARVLIVLPDQEPVKTGGVFAPFFGVPALTMTLAGRLARRFDSPILYTWAERTDRGFEIRFRECCGDPTAVDPLEAAEALNRGIENCVRACPEQYLWSYKRFKTRPVGDTTGL